MSLGLPKIPSPEPQLRYDAWHPVPFLISRTTVSKRQQEGLGRTVASRMALSSECIETLSRTVWRAPPAPSHPNTLQKCADHALLETKDWGGGGPECFPVDIEILNISHDICSLYEVYVAPHLIDLAKILKPFISLHIPLAAQVKKHMGMPAVKGWKLMMYGPHFTDKLNFIHLSHSQFLDLQLHMLLNYRKAGFLAVKTIENAEKNGKVIDKWVRDISDLHRAKPPPTVHYTKRMPDIDSLMQEWPGEVEELLKEVDLPSAALEVDLPQYVDILCGILDIPVYKSRIQSLHVLFTLYSVFKNSAHFRHLAEENYMDNNEAPEGEHLVL
ncbi:unnamed protein product, partial [Meganyctiphanes norvegica]